MPWKAKSKEDLRSFLEKLSSKAKKLKAVAMDMSGSYYSAVRQWLSRIDIVLDHYHVSALMNQAMDEIRRGQQKEFDELRQKTLKGNRFLLLRNYDSLNPDRKVRLDALLQPNQPLFLAHTMKSSSDSFGRKKILKSAKSFLDIWLKDSFFHEHRSMINQCLRISW
jgi:transposase